MNIRKIIEERPVLFLILILLGGAVIVILVFLSMLHRLQEFESQERLMAEDINLVNGLMRTRDQTHFSPQLVALNDAATVMEEISALGNTHSIIFLSMARQDKSKSAYKKIDTLPVDLETQSTYKQLGFFMGALNDLRRGIVLIDSFQITRDAQEPGKVRSKMHMHICLKKAVRGKK